MCDICDGMTYDELEQKTRRAIETTGCTIVAVDGSADRHGDDASSASPMLWAYTIGLAESFGTAELVLTDMAHESAYCLLDLVREGLESGDALEAIVADMRCTLVPVHPHHVASDLFDSWTRYYGGDASDTTWLQLVPPPDAFCSDHQHSMTRLDRPRPAQRTGARRSTRRRVRGREHGHLRPLT